MAVKKRQFTPKQKLFVLEYLKDLNATQACIRAGYSKKNAGKIRPELLGKSRVREKIGEAMEKRAKKTEVTAERVLEELGKIAFSEPDGKKLHMRDKLKQASM